jgi:hypothetical protein
VRAVGDAFLPQGKEIARQQEDQKQLTLRGPQQTCSSPRRDVQGFRGQAREIHVAVKGLGWSANRTGSLQILPNLFSQLLKVRPVNDSAVRQDPFALLQLFARALDGGAWALHCRIQVGRIHL